jgi:hypothetical protein
MRYPPSLTFKPGVSLVYRVAALCFAIFLVAMFSILIPPESHFDLKVSLFGLLALAALLWLLHDAWRQPQSSLAYSQGQWRCLQAHTDVQADVAGTLRLHIDLNFYMLVSFRAHTAPNRFFQTKIQWFHLEARHAQHAASSARAQAWLALRRAVYSPMEPTDETVVA